MTRLPRINDHVGVRVHEWNAQLASRVEDASPGRLAIALPSDGKAEFHLPPGIDVDIEWVTPRGLMRIAGKAVGHANLGVPTVLVDLVGTPETFQRRDFVRVRAMVELSVSPAAPGREAEPVPGITIDVSGGGVLAHIPDLEAKVDDRMRLTLSVPGGDPIETVARICRKADVETFAFAFEQIDRREQERLIRFVFSRMRASAGKAA